MMHHLDLEQEPLVGLPIAFGFLLSAIAHLFIILMFFQTPKFEKPQPFVTEVTLEPPSALARPPQAKPQPGQAQDNAGPKPMPIQRQIVTSPDNPPEARENRDARLESDRNTFADKEQVKKGDGKESGVPGPEAEKQQPPAPEPREQPKELQKAAKAPAPDSPSRQRAPQSAAKEKGKPVEPAEPGAFSLSNKPLQQLKLNDADVLQKFAMNRQKEEPSLKERLGGQQQTGDFSAYQPFSRPMGSGARFVGKNGSTDYLPNLPDGDITLLNTKANKFATFVSRVATQVFGQMRSGGLDVMAGQEIMKAEDFNRIRVRLSRKGELIDISMEKGSGSGRFDEVLVNSARVGAKDPNPPGDAVASDGTIHFIFQSQIWGQVGSDPRTGMQYRRIWLLLATGLE